MSRLIVTFRHVMQIYPQSDPQSADISAVGSDMKAENANIVSDPIHAQPYT
ncbi:hypothetical protein PIB30_046753 [Stylosanthes scabra]|uniref:Uncharacterized protein n=1 Tax=Stylosanthes scabra TaxID=79078 RepID=A0ABU6UF63_9FABA|nr:hypothetical protein [Stylosanthes scabra]